MALVNTPSFQITRHATSCYNIKAFPTFLGPFEADRMPSLAKYGIDETIALAREEKESNRFRASTVCVSNLIRTWMTAVLLYAFTDSTPKTEITFRICPHLKEIGYVGNDARPLTESIPKFIDFLNNIKSKENYTTLRKIHLLIPKFIESPHKYWVKITITIPKDKKAHTVIHDKSLFCNKTKVIDGIVGYTKNGNISEFMTWFCTSFPKERDTVHVVAHSHIMKDYFNEKCKDVITSDGKKFNIKKHTLTTPANIGIDAQNCWTFTTTAGIKPDDLIESIKHGYPNPDKIGKDAREPSTEQEGSLCRKSVEKIVCPATGGYHTKKNRKKLRRTLRRL